MDKQKTWKNVNNKKERKNCGWLRNKLKRATEKAMKEHFTRIYYDKIIEFQRTAHYDLTYMKTKGPGWKKISGFKPLASKILKEI